MWALLTIYYSMMGLSCSYFMNKVAKQNSVGFVVSAVLWPIMFPMAFIGVYVIDLNKPPITGG